MASHPSSQPCIPGSEPTPDRRAVRGLIAAEAVSALGNAMTIVALPWLAYAMTGSLGSAGIVLAAEVAPVALLGLFSARVIERMGARATMVASDAGRCVLLVAIGLLAATGMLTWPLLLVLVFLTGCAVAPHYAGERTVLAQLVPEGPELVRASARLRGAMHAAQLAGPVVAGLLIAGFDVHVVLLLDGLTFGLSALLLGVALPKERHEPGQDDGGGDLLSGIRLLWRDRSLRRTVTCMVGSDMLVAAMAMVGVVALVRHHWQLDADVAGLALGAFGAGALLGSVLADRMAPRIAARQLGMGAVALQLLPLWLLVLPGADAGHLLVAMALVGMLAPAVSAGCMSEVSMRTPEAAHPHVFTAVVVASQVAIPAGYVASGALADRLGTPALMLALAASGSALAVAAAAWLVRDRGASPPLEPSQPDDDRSGAAVGSGHGAPAPQGDGSIAVLEQASPS